MAVCAFYEQREVITGHLNLCRLRRNVTKCSTLSSGRTVISLHCQKCNCTITKTWSSFLIYYIYRHNQHMSLCQHHLWWSVCHRHGLARPRSLEYSSGSPAFNVSHSSGVHVSHPAAAFISNNFIIYFQSGTNQLEAGFHPRGDVNVTCLYWFLLISTPIFFFLNNFITFLAVYYKCVSFSALSVRDELLEQPYSLPPAITYCSNH